MPNGGSDCCGTCPFNRKNRGQRGYAHADDPGPDHCEIRDLPITGSAFYTYCSNHPGHNRDLTRVPVGPVWTHAEDGGREVWRAGPDTPEVRAQVLRLLTAATPDPVDDYPAGLSLVEAAILHAGELGDPRFTPHLDRIRLFPGFGPEGGGAGGFSRDPARSAAFAARALVLILPPDAVRPFVNDTVRGVAATVDQSGDPAGLAILADALQEAGCTHPATLEYLRSPDTRVPNWVVDVVLGRVGV